MARSTRRSATRVPRGGSRIALDHGTRYRPNTAPTPWPRAAEQRGGREVKGGERHPRCIEPETTRPAVTPQAVRRVAMNEQQIKGPLQLLGEMIIRQNTRTLVIR